MSGHLIDPARVGNYYITTVYVGTGGHLRRFKVLDATGTYVPGGLFRTSAEAEAFIADLTRGETT